MLEVEEPTRHLLAAEYLNQLALVVQQVPVDALSQAIDAILDAHAARRRVYVMGNGGSSATASHFVCDLVKTAKVPGQPPLRAFSLTDNTPLLTAWSNDQAYEDAFAEYIEAVADAGDVIIGITASGNSPNIVNALRSARGRGATTIAFVGFDGGAARHSADVVVHVPRDDYGLVEDSHSAICHAITNAVRGKLLLTRA